MNNDMKYTYEFLRKCHGMRFRATIGNKPQEGIIKVMSDCVMLCFGDEDYGRLFTFERRDTLSFSAESFRVLPSDFEIVPRDPETYKDWQVGDKISRNGRVRVIIFRCGEVVLYKDRDDECCSFLYTCEELFNHDARLVLTDIEKQILEERKTGAWKPQDGDIVAWKTWEDDGDFAISIFKGRESGYATLYVSGGVEYSGNLTLTMKIMRPATDEEKQRLFDAMAKDGKRWNAEKKVVEDIPKTHELKKGDLVLARIDRSGEWKLRVFKGRVDGSDRQFKASVDGFLYIYQYCIPYNEETKHLLGTTEDYEEGER